MINHLLHVFIFSHTLPNLCHLPCFHVILSFLSPPACSSLLICHFPSSPSPTSSNTVTDSPPLPPPPLSAVPPTSLSPVVSCCCSLSSLSVFHLPFPLLNTSLYSSKTKDGERQMMCMCASACTSCPFPCHSSPRSVSKNGISKRLHSKQSDD